MTSKRRGSMIELTNSEKEVMEVLWKSDQQLTAREIVIYCVNKSWKPSYIYLMINSLLEKGMIQVEGEKRSVKKYARAYTPTLTEAEWYARKLISQTKDKNAFICTVLRELLKEIDDLEEIVELEKKINKRKNAISQ